MRESALLLGREHNVCPVYLEACKSLIYLWVLGLMGLQKNGFFKQSGARAGLSCGLAEAQGPKTSELMAPDTSGLENSKTCSACGKIKSRVDFGKKQWAARAVRRCVACVESGVKVVFCDHGRGRDCAVCDAAAAASAAAAAAAHLLPSRRGCAARPRGRRRARR